MTPPRLAVSPRDAPRRHGALRKPGKERRRLGRVVLYLVLAALALPVVPILIYRFVPPPLTPLMAIRFFAGAPIRQRYVPLDRISPALVRAVVASEDEKFCFHHGFDWDAMGNAWRDWRAGREPKGASTITMQTAKNLFSGRGAACCAKGSRPI